MRFGKNRTCPQWPINKTHGSIYSRHQPCWRRQRIVRYLITMSTKPVRRSSVASQNTTFDDVKVSEGEGRRACRTSASRDWPDLDRSHSLPRSLQHADIVALRDITLIIVYNFVSSTRCTTPVFDDQSSRAADWGSATATTLNYFLSLSIIIISPTSRSSPALSSLSTVSRVEPAIGCIPIVYWILHAGITLQPANYTVFQKTRDHVFDDKFN